jgi:hypothetical protein
MANSIFRSNDHHQNKTLHVVVGLFCLMMLVHKGGATLFTVGGSKGWTVPDPELHYNQWAENNRFQIGDSLGKTKTFSKKKLVYSMLHIWWIYI